VAPAKKPKVKTSLAGPDDPKQHESKCAAEILSTCGAQCGASSFDGSLSITYASVVSEVGSCNAGKKLCSKYQGYPNQLHIDDAN